MIVGPQISNLHQLADVTDRHLPLKNLLNSSAAYAMNSTQYAISRFGACLTN
jgi:hypothetical protein